MGATQLQAGSKLIAGLRSGRKPKGMHRENAARQVLGLPCYAQHCQKASEAAALLQEGRAPPWPPPQGPGSSGKGLSRLQEAALVSIPRGEATHGEEEDGDKSNIVCAAGGG